MPPIIRTKSGSLYVQAENELYILYGYLEGVESDPEQDAEAIGELVGNLHRVMKNYPGELVKRNKHFYIGRYIDILRNRKYPRAEEFFIYGEQLWDKIKGLPRGFCHGDMYSGNIHREMGMTVTSYITNVRIKHACQFLCRAAVSIQQIAYMVGYVDEQYFFKVFKKHTGMTPMKYRVQQAGK